MNTITPCGKQTYECWAMPFRPALPMNRAVFHRLGLTVGIAIALAGCNRLNPLPDWREGEIPPSTYRHIAAFTDEQERPLLRRFMADGKITYGELAELNDFNESRATPLADVKRELSGAAQ